MDPVSTLGLSLMRTGTYEEDMVAVLEKYVSRGSIFIDLGANEGYFSVVAAPLVGAEGRVLAIEPPHHLSDVIVANAILRCSRSGKLCTSLE